MVSDSQLHSDPNSLPTDVSAASSIQQKKQQPSSEPRRVRFSGEFRDYYSHISLYQSFTDFLLVVYLVGTKYIVDTGESSPRLPFIRGPPTDHANFPATLSK